MSLSREEIIRMAREADGHAYTNRHMKDEPAFAFSIDRLERFANAAYAAGAAAERETCAMVCEDSKSLIWNLSDDAIKSAGNNVCDNLAATIRARGDK